MDEERIESLACALADELPEELGDALMRFAVLLMHLAPAYAERRQMYVTDGPQRYATVRLDLPSAPHYGWPAWPHAAE